MRLLKKTVSVLLVLMLVVSVLMIAPFSASADSTLSGVFYLKPDSSWLAKGWDLDPRFTAYFFNDSDSAWVDMTKIDYGTYSVTAPAGDWTGLIFLRMDGRADHTQNGWDSGNIWGQTVDYTSATIGDNNCFTVTDTSTWNQVIGTWSKLAQTTVSFVPGGDWAAANARYALYGFTDSANNWYDLSADGDSYKTTFYYAWDKIIICKMKDGTTDNSWDNKELQTVNLDYVDGGIFALTGAKEGDNYNATYAKVAGYSLVLKDNIGINFYLNLQNAAGAAANFTVGGETVSGALNAATGVTGANYVTSYYVPAKSMTDDITMKLSMNGAQWISKTYSVATYAAEAAETYASDEDLRKLLCDTLDYGDAVQKFFEYNGDNGYAGSFIDDVDENWSRTAAPAVLDDTTTINSLKDGSADLGLKYAGATMSTTSQTAIRLFFTVTDEDKFAATVAKIGNNVLEFKDSTSGSMKYIEITGISAKDIFEDYSVRFENGSNANSYTYNAANYYDAVVGGSYAETFRTVMKAMYNYSVSAKNYSEGGRQSQ